MSPRLSMKPARVATAVAKAVRGIERHFKPGLNIPMRGASWDGPTLLAKLAPVAKANRELADARVIVKQKIAAREAAHAQARAFLVMFKLGMQARFGASNPLLAEFGLPVDKPRRRRTAAEKAASAAEGVRTRRVRGSYGKPGRRRG